MAAVFANLHAQKCMVRNEVFYVKANLRFWASNAYAIAYTIIL